MDILLGLPHFGWGRDRNSDSSVEQQGAQEKVAPRYEADHVFGRREGVSASLLPSFFHILFTSLCRVEKRNKERAAKDRQAKDELTAGGTSSRKSELRDTGFTIPGAGGHKSEGLDEESAAGLAQVAENDADIDDVSYFKNRSKSDS